jgi:hypothetical protein
MRGLGAAAIAAPFFTVASERVQAQTARRAKRVIFWFTPNGTVHRHWRPTGEGASFAFPAGSILEPLADHRPHLLVLDGLNFERVRGGSHEGGMEHMLTGGGATSVDQYIAAAVGGDTPFPSLEFGVQTSAWGAGVQTRMCYNNAHQFIHPEDNPSNAFRRLFAGVSADPTEVDPAVLARRSVIDVVKAELGDLRSELGVLERRKLDAHLDSVERIERRLKGEVTGGACTPPAAPAAIDTRSNERFPDIGELQMDLLVLAASCGLSRVLSLQWSHTVSPTILSWAGGNEGHHELSHKDDSNAAGVQAFVANERWFATQFANFLTKLDRVTEPDGSGTLLETSIVVWCKELGDGRLHDFKSVPFVIAGSGNGFFKTGRYLKLGGQPHQKLLVSLCHGMGLTNDSFGVADITGSLPELVG